MANWFDKTDEEIIQRLKNVLRTEDFQFIGKYEPVPQKDFGFFKDVRSLSGVRKFYPKDDGSPDERKIRPLEIFTKAYDKLVADKWYKFYSVPAANTLRLIKRNPFLMQTDWKRVRDIFLLSGKELIDNIKNDALNTPEAIAGNLMRAIETISIDINTEPTTFIFELIQNADDYPNSENNVSITFQIDNSHLIIKHNGSKFEVNNTVALCGVNEGDKREESNKIGYKGIGFKSIFKDANFAYIKSGDFSFRFDEEVWRQQGIEIFWHITPINTPINEFKQVLKTESNVNIVIRPRALQALKTYRETFVTHFNDERILLFLRNVKSLIFDSAEEKFEISNSSLKWKIFTKSNVEIPEEETNELNRRINFPDKRIPVKFHDITLTELGFGFKINENKVEPISDGFIYAYLPTKVNLGFSFILNGNFIPDASRTKIYSDLTWNSFLFEKAGELFINQIITLLTEGFDKQSVLNQIPSFSEILINLRDNDKIIFINCFKRGFEKEILNKHFIPTQSGTLETLSNILIDETGLAELLGDKFSQLTGVIEKLIDSKVGEGIEKIKDLIKQNDVGLIYDAERLKDDIKTKLQVWLKEPLNNFKFIDHLNSNDSLKHLLKSEEIILSSNGDLFKASNLFAEVPEEIAFLSPNQVNKEVLNYIIDKEVKIEFKKFESDQFFSDSILGKAETLNESFGNKENLLFFWQFVFNNWAELESDKAIINCLKSIDILCKSDTPHLLVKSVISKSYLSAEFNLSNEIESTVLSFIQDAHFISEKYISKNGDEIKWRKIFNHLGVVSDLQKAIGDLLPNLSNINEQQHFIITKQLFKYWKDNKDKETSLNKGEIGLIKNSLRLKCIDNIYRATPECFISDHYQTSKIIDTILVEVSLSNQISSDYSNTQISEWNTFFKEIGCISLEEKQHVLDAKLSFIVSHQDELQEKHFEILKSISYLFKAKNENNLDFKSALSQIKLKTNNENWQLPDSIHLSSVFCNTSDLDLQMDENIKGIYFLSSEYKNEVFNRDFFKELGVKSGFEFKVFVNIALDKFPNQELAKSLMFSKEFEKRRTFLLTKYNQTDINKCSSVTNYIEFYCLDLVVNQKYNSNFIHFIKKNKQSILFQQSSLLNNGSNYGSTDNNFVSFIKNHETVPNKNNELKKPINLISLNFEHYISDNSLFPKVDFRNFNEIEGASLEKLVGIRQILNENHCIELLSRTENRITLEKIAELEIVKILKGYSPTDVQKSKLFLLNENLSWKPINELFFSNDSKINIKPEQHLHNIFLDLANDIGIKDLSEDSLEMKTVPENPPIKDEIQIFFKEKAKFIAFKIDQVNWVEIESNITEQLASFNFHEVDFVAKVFPKNNPIYEQIIDFYYDEKKKEVFYKGFWKNNKNVMVFLHNQIQNEKIETVWFDNIINRWDDKKIGDTLLDTFGFIPPPWIKGEDVPESSKPQIDVVIWNDYSDEEADFIKKVLKIDNNKDAQYNANTTAKIKTLGSIIAKNGDYANIQTSDEGQFLKVGDDEILVRSAQKGLLYLDLFSWKRLAEPNVLLSLYSKNEIKFFVSQEELLSFTRRKNKFGVIRMPENYDVTFFNSLSNIYSKEEWKFVFIVDENTNDAKSYKEVMDYSDPNLFDADNF